jgi:thiosulfate reductase cytochrome b subunit
MELTMTVEILGPAPDHRAAPQAAIHPLTVRIAHWINAAAMIVMITSGWKIYNASPIFPFLFPEAITLGGWLGGAIQWHFAAMWLLAINGGIYLGYGILSGRLYRKLWPISFRAIVHDVSAAFTAKLSHDDLTTYNSVQKLLYTGVIASAVLVVLSGLAIWKPVQFGPLTRLFGDFDSARVVHFVAMSLIAGFVVIHVVMSLLVPRSLLAMLRGR